MEFFLNEKKINADEKCLIEYQIQSDLVDHLYHGCLPGTLTGVLTSIALFVDYFGSMPIKWLCIWILAFNFMMCSLTILYFCYLYRKDKSKNLTLWERLYSLMMIGCACAWLPSILLLPEDPTRQYLALIAIFLATTGYAMGSIGQFYLCAITLNIILVPLAIYSFYFGGTFYNIIGVYSLLYMFFMMGTNLRSTTWFRDSLKLKLENTLVSYQVSHDMLTNLPNQNFMPQFLDYAKNFIQPTPWTFAVICFSLNRMEMLYDSLGHAAGDKIIKETANRLIALAIEFEKHSELRMLISISRKDIFTIVIFPLVAQNSEKKVAQLFSVLDKPFYPDVTAINLTASIGIVFYDRDSQSMDSLLQKSAAAVLRAKQYGGNRLEFYSKEITAKMSKQFQIEHDLHSVLKRKELQLYYQPLIRIDTGELVGMEALLRWRHKLHGYISPAEFIPIAEETGLIVLIGEWVLEEACKQTLVWHRMGFDKLKVAVNLSPQQLRGNRILDSLKKVLDSTKINPRFLELELTETTILDESVIRLMKNFKEMGLSLAVDDFGTGYSGLSYLKRFAIDKLKIDQSFIRDIPVDNDSMTIVSAIIAMAKELNILVLAEGVESAEQVNFLKSKDCDFAQGYYFSKPLDANHFTQLLLNQHRLLSV